MAVFLSPMGGAGWQFFNNSGSAPLSGGKLYTYAAGTTTPLVTYTSVSGATPHTNPIVLDSAGRIPGGEVWLTSVPYKFVLKTSADVLIATYDDIIGIGAASYQVQNFTGNGSTFAFTLANAPEGENATNVYINGVYQQKNTYSVAGAVLTFSEAPPVTSSIEVNYV